MNFVADCVLSEANQRISRKGEPYYIVKGVIVRSDDCSAFSGIPFEKFVSKDIFDELMQFDGDRLLLDFGASVVSMNSREHDVAFNLYLNGVYKPEPTEAGTDAGLWVPQTVPAENIKKNVSPSGEAPKDKSK